MRILLKEAGSYETGSLKVTSFANENPFPLGHEKQIREKGEAEFDKLADKA